MEQADFEKAFVASIQNSEAVSSAIVKAVSSAIKNEIQPLTSLVLSMKNEMKAEITTEISQLKDEIKALHACLQDRDAQITDLNKKIAMIEQEKMALIDDKLDELEQYSRKNSLRLSGLKETQEEDPLALFLSLCNNDLAINPPLNPKDIDCVHRVGPKEKGNRQLLVKFTSYRARKKVYDERKKLQSTTSGRWINEDLTRKRAALLFRARNMKQDGRIAGCWSSDGRILIKNVRGTIIPVHNVAGLEDIGKRE